MEIQEEKLPNPHTPPKPYVYNYDIIEDRVIEEYEIPDKLADSELKQGELKISHSSDDLIKQSHLKRKSWDKPTAKLPIHSCRHESVSVQSNRTDKSKSLEQRLHGATAAIRHLEKQVKEKDIIISSLQGELQEKNKMIDALQAEYTSSQIHLKTSMLQSSLTSVMKKKEKELEKIIKEKELKIEDDKKTIARLTEINKNLLSNIKEKDKKQYELENIVTDASDKINKSRNLKEENEHLSLMVRKLQKNISLLEDDLEETKQRYQSLLASSMEFEEQTRELYKANQILNENILKLLEN
ncbi:unnamed protein product [Blepharisma stoltei]|uniref:Uncharacterized protein n=1 Tax=Blepharisma stoltei TaxID=1481888 RepID=A0AAU9K137_9CILI|nr:unnamed protein product [Blepharisma stoltei]